MKSNRLMLQIGVLLLSFLALLAASGAVFAHMVNRRSADAAALNRVAQEKMLAERYAREVNLALIALATEDWPLLLETRRLASESARQFEEIHRELSSGVAGAGALRSPEITSQLDGVGEEWELLREAAVRALRTDYGRLRGNPNVQEVSLQAKRVTEELEQLEDALVVRSQRAITRSHRQMLAMAGLGLALFAIQWVFSRQRIVLPLLRAQRALSSRAHDEGQMGIVGSLVEHSAAVISVKDLQGRYLMANRRFEELVAVTRDKLLGSNDSEIFPAATAKTIRSTDFRALVEGGIEVEEVIPSLDGEVRVYVTQKFPLRDLHGRPTALCAIAVDITEKKRTEHALRTLVDASSRLSGLDSSQLLEASVSLPIPEFADWSALIVEEPDGEAEELTVVTAAPNAEGLTRPVRRAVRREALPDDLLEAFKGGEPRVLRARPPPDWFDGDNEGTRDRGSEEGASLAIPLSARGHLQGVWLLGRAASRPVLRDWEQSLARELAARIGMALENARLYRAALIAARTREEFLSIASHELKTPLTSLKLKLQAASRKLASPDWSSRRWSLVELLAGADKQISRFNALIEGLLDMSNVSLGRLKLERVPMDLAESVREVVGSLAAQAEQDGTPLTLELPPALEGCWDPLRIEQVVSNLVNNALKYGKGAPVRVELRREGDRALLTVSDQGTGIARADLLRIFEPFERAVSARKISGFGLGLFIAREVIDAHGGTIRVTSEPGRGSTFEVELPLRVPRETSAQSEWTSPAIESEGATGR